MNSNSHRNQPADHGNSNDPTVRDESAIQPGINPVGDSKYDNDNEELSKTAADDFSEEKNFDANADPAFDEVDKE